MKFLCLKVFVLCTLVVRDLAAREIPGDGEVSIRLGSHSQQFAFVDEKPNNEESSDLWIEGAHERALIASVIENALNDFRDVVINGNDELPPLDPFVLDQAGPLHFTLTTGVRGTASVSNFRAEGLQWYVVDQVSFNTLRLNLGVHVILPWFSLTGSYDTEVRLLIDMLTHRAGGNFRVFLNRFEVGVEARLGTSLADGHLLLRELAVSLDIHDTLIQIDGMTGSTLVNSVISSYIQNLTQDVIQAELANASQMISEELFDTINDILKDYTLADILG